MIEYKLFKLTDLNNGYEHYNYYLAPNDNFDYIYDKYSLKVKQYLLVNNVVYSFVFYNFLHRLYTY